MLKSPETMTISDESDYWLPEDKAECLNAVLTLLHAPGDTFVDCYGLSQPDMANEIIAADAEGVNISIACDHIQACGATTKAILAKITAHFAVRGVSTVTITTAGPLSDAPGDIYHKKVMVVKATDGGADFCIEGSWNFTSPASSEANTLRVFRSNEWSAKEIADHIAVCAWARSVHPEWQIATTKVSDELPPSTS